jgi:hypothetical protein
MEFTLSSKNLVVFSKLIILFTPPSKKLKPRIKHSIYLQSYPLKKR